MSQITTVSFFKLSGFKRMWWAFTQMQLGISRLDQVNGLEFFKLMGSGSGNGFSILPNFSTYVLLCVWESEAHAVDFFEKNAFFKEYQANSDEQFNVFASAAVSHGYWEGKQPFNTTEELDKDSPVMVLTRGSIKKSKLISFWRRVNRVSQNLSQYEGSLMSIGVGEWPLIQQATLSLWKSKDEMMHFAYKNEKHQRVIKLTRKLNWYQEELFARFKPYKFEGRWNGRDMKNFIEAKN